MTVVMACACVCVGGFSLQDAPIPHGHCVMRPAGFPPSPAVLGVGQGSARSEAACRGGMGVSVSSCPGCGGSAAPLGTRWPAAPAHTGSAACSPR